MNKATRVILLFVPILAIFLAVLWKTSRSEQEEEIHYHAGFIVYADGKKQDFSNVKYMHIEPCADEEKEKEESPEHEQLEKAHIHDFVGDVVHVHRKNAVWGDLFTNIKYDISGDIQGYINGEKVENFLKEPIKPYENMLIVIGDEKGINVRETVSREHILEIESKSESCGN